jgi:hypothetical protein
MARLSNLPTFNLQRQEYVKLKNIEDETLVMSRDELKQFFVEYLEDDLNKITDNLSKKQKDAFSHLLLSKLSETEHKLLSSLNKKIDSVVENIVSRSTTRIIEEEVNKRVNIKLEKIKNML